MIIKPIDRLGAKRWHGTAALTQSEGRRASKVLSKYSDRESVSVAREVKRLTHEVEELKRNLAVIYAWGEIDDQQPEVITRVETERGSIILPIAGTPKTGAELLALWKQENAFLTAEEQQGLPDGPVYARQLREQSQLRQDHQETL